MRETWVLHSYILHGNTEVEWLLLVLDDSNGVETKKEMDKTTLHLAAKDGKLNVAWPEV